MFVVSRAVVKWDSYYKQVSNNFYLILKVLFLFHDRLYFQDQQRVCDEKYKLELRGLEEDITTMNLTLLNNKERVREQHTETTLLYVTIHSSVNWFV